MRYLINILFVLLTLSSVAQSADTVTNRFVPTGIRVGLDAISIIKSATQDNFSGYEFNADIDLYRYYLAFDMGHWQRDFRGDLEDYTNDGNYMRAGIDVNFLTKDEDKNMFFLGMRYGWGKFSEQVTIESNDPVWGTRTEIFNNDNVKAHWFELTSGLRVKMYKFFWMGYTARYKFGLGTKGDKNLLPSDVPGYGRTDKNTTWGFNYQLFFRIPIPKVK